MFSKSAINYMLIFGTSVSGIIALLVIGVPIVAPFIEESYSMPEEIKQWGGVIIGFYFGSFLTVISDFIKNTDQQ